MLFQHGNNSVFYNVDLFQYLQLFQCCTALHIFRTAIKTAVIQGRKGYYQGVLSWWRAAFVALRKIFPVIGRPWLRATPALRLFARRTKYALSLRLFPARLHADGVGDEQGIDLA
ncbi:hypothetical protein LE191_23890 [Janthinobacterium sp. HSC-3S05]|uniref:hypothetical protein n=1 Tax=Janthinobacterium lividum TaxID=29581 RepID=UPI001CD823A7|nr:hypothetical protein [Janthinobacterium lividum]MCA1863159.1 hypothetical protein [Janthinobacterium lividum]